MVAIAEGSTDTRQTLLYNEQKLEEKQALFLGAFNFLQEDDELTFENKLHRLRDLTVLNDRVEVHTAHISVNFHPGDILDDKKMKQIAAEFMGKLGFKDQPYLVYRHLDAGHPHFHIVSVNIRPDGSRIENDLRAPWKMMKFCQEIEKRHQLTPAGEGDWGASRELKIPPGLETKSYPTILQYGKTPTRTGIENVLDHVLDQYIYTSLDQLNALLSFYNVRADRGNEEGVLYANRGLYYRVINKQGQKLGAPIKASSLRRKPILHYLEQKFETNKLRLNQSMHITTYIDWYLHHGVASLDEFKRALRREHIGLITPPVIRRRYKHPLPASVFDGHAFYFVDYDLKTIHRDTELGPRYTAAAILARSGLDKTLHSLAIEQQLTLTKKENLLLQASQPDSADNLQLLLRLSLQHDKLVEAQLKEQQSQRLRHRHHLPGGL